MGGGRRSERTHHSVLEMQKQEEGVWPENVSSASLWPPRAAALTPNSEDEQRGALEEQVGSSGSPSSPDWFCNCGRDDSARSRLLARLPVCSQSFGFFTHSEILAPLGSSAARGDRKPGARGPRRRCLPVASGLSCLTTGSTTLSSCAAVF